MGNIENLEELGKSTDTTSNCFSALETDYIKEVLDYPEDLVDRIDEFSSSVPPKAIDADTGISDIIEPVKDNIPSMYLEAPSDTVQIEQISDTLKSTEGLNFDEWQEMSYEERCEALQNAECKIAEIEHRPACEISYQSLEEGDCGHFNPEDKSLTINSNYVESSSFSDYREALDTLIHEGRHAYQDYNLNEREVHPRGGEIEKWKYNMFEAGYRDARIYGFPAYAMQPVESDASAFAADVVNNFLRV